MKLQTVIIYISLLLGLSVSAHSQGSELSTAVFQAAGLNSEGVHPTFITHSSSEEIAEALGQVYSSNETASRPKTLYVLIPDSMPELEAQAYRQEIEIQFQKAGFAGVPVTLIVVPVISMVKEGEALLSKNELMASEIQNVSPQDRKVIAGFYQALRNKIKDLKAWSERISNWREWKQSAKSKWNNQTSQEKDKAVLTIFGAARGIPGVAIYANDAGLNPINIARMVIAYAADIFFTVAPQKIANFPSKIRFPELSNRTQHAISWGASLGLMSLGYWGGEINPANLHFQLSQASPFVKEWFDRSIELKSFLFGYSLSLGIPLTFLTLGYFAKGGEGSGALSPFDISFLLEFAGLQIVDGVMGMFGSRGARVLGDKGYFSGRKENIFYSILNVLGQMQGLSVATGNTVLYKSCLVVRSVLQGLTFFVSRVLPPKTPNVFIFHAKIGDRERESFLYTEGILDPKKIESLDTILTQVASETPGPSGLNRWLGQLGSVFLKNRWTSEQSSSASASGISPSTLRCLQALGHKS